MSTTPPSALFTDAIFAQASDPETPGALLHELAWHESVEVRLAVAGNPAASRETLDALLDLATTSDEAEALWAGPVVAAILGNPGVEFVLLDDPQWLLEQSSFVCFTMASSPRLLPSLWHALREHKDERVRMRLITSPAAPPAAWLLFGFESELDALLRLLILEDDPAAQASLIATMAGHAELASWLQIRPSRLASLPPQKQLALAGSPALTPLLWEALCSQESARLKLLLARSPAALPGAWQRLGLPTEGPVDLSFAELGASKLEGLRDCPYTDSFTALNLARNGLRDEAIGSLTEGVVFPRLASLDLSENDLGPRGAEGLARSAAFPALRSLALARNPLRGGGVAALAGSSFFSRLVELSLWDTGPGEEGILALARSSAFPELRALDLSRNGLGEREILALEQALFQLETLNLNSNLLGERGLTALARLSALSRLLSLDLTHTQAGPRGALALAAAFPALRRLKMDSCQLGAEGALALAQSAPRSDLAVLGLANNELGEAGVESIAQSSSLRRLTELDLSFNRVGARGAAALARSSCMAGLIKLDLRNNQLGPAGIMALSEGPFPGLRELRLADNQAGEAGLRALVRAPFFPSLTHLCLDPKKLDAGAQKTLHEATADLPQLKVW